MFFCNTNHTLLPRRYTTPLHPTTHTQRPHIPSLSCSSRVACWLCVVCVVCVVCVSTYLLLRRHHWKIKVMCANLVERRKLRSKIVDSMECETWRALAIWQATCFGIGHGGCSCSGEGSIPELPQDVFRVCRQALPHGHGCSAWALCWYVVWLCCVVLCCVVCCVVGLCGVVGRLSLLTVVAWSYARAVCVCWCVRWE